MPRRIHKTAEASRSVAKTPHQVAPSGLTSFVRQPCRPSYPVQPYRSTITSESMILLPRRENPSHAPSNWACRLPEFANAQLAATGGGQRRSQTRPAASRSSRLIRKGPGWSSSLLIRTRRWPISQGQRLCDRRRPDRMIDASALYRIDLIGTSSVAASKTFCRFFAETLAPG